MPMMLSRSDARRAARACRALAEQERRQGDQFGEGPTRDMLHKSATRLDLLALKFEAHAAAGPVSSGEPAPPRNAAHSPQSLNPVR